MKNILAAMISLGVISGAMASSNTSPILPEASGQTEREQVTQPPSQLPDIVIDLSHNNTPVYFQTLARKSGILGVIHKATEGGGLLAAGAPSFTDENNPAGFIDPTYQERAAEAAKTNLLWGAYHFLRPGDGKKQADFFLQTAQNIEEMQNRPLLLMLDLEIEHTLKQPTLEQAYAVVQQVYQASGQTVLKIAEDFAQRIHDKTGVWPILYGSPYILQAIIGKQLDTVLKNCLLNIAHWIRASQPTIPAPWKVFTLWQYTSQGSVKGVTGAVDRVRFNNSIYPLWNTFPFPHRQVEIISNNARPTYP